MLGAKRGGQRIAAVAHARLQPTAQVGVEAAARDPPLGRSHLLEEDLLRQAAVGGAQPPAARAGERRARELLGEVRLAELGQRRRHVLRRLRRRRRGQHEHGAAVHTDSAIVRGGEDGEHLAAVVGHEAAPAVRHLVRPNDEFHLCALKEGARHIGAPSDRVGAAAADVEAALLLRVGPQRVEHQQLVVVGRRLGARPAVLERGEPLHVEIVLAHQAAVDDKSLAAEGGADRQVDEERLEEVEGVDVVLRRHLVVEAAAHEDGPHVDVGQLVVAARHVDAVGVDALEQQDQREDLAGVGAAVGDVAVEEVVVLLGRRAVRLEDEQHVLQLAVRVADDDLTRALVDGRQRQHRAALGGDELDAGEDRLVQEFAVERHGVGEEQVLEERQRVLRRRRRREREAGVLGLDRHRLELVAVRLEELGEDGRLEADVLGRPRGRRIEHVL